MLDTLRNNGKPAYAGPKDSAYGLARFHSAACPPPEVLAAGRSRFIISLIFIAVSVDPQLTCRKPLRSRAPKSRTARS